MYVDFTAFQTRFTNSDREKEAFNREGTRDCRREGGGRENRLKAVLTVDCMFGNEKEHPKTQNLGFGMSHFRSRELITSQMLNGWHLQVKNGVSLFILKINQI